jgi:hypothetical protein
MGQPVTRVGLVFGTEVWVDRGSVDAEIRLHLNNSSYGPEDFHLEAQLAVGAWLGLGAPTSLVRWDYGHIAPLASKYGIGYRFTQYLDTRQTSQPTGTFRLKFGRLYLLTENDAFVPIVSADRFRSGSAAIIWATEERLYELRTVFWHGDSGGSRAQTVKDSDYPCRFGYRDFSACQFGGFSNGVVGMVLHQKIPFGQTLQLGVGVDAEQVRNFVQNRMIHDMWFFPTAWTPVRNLHYPMLRENGELYLFQEGQTIRPIRPFWMVGLNQFTWY